jgi:PAS domain S-box-containing protein
MERIKILLHHIEALESELRAVCEEESIKIAREEEKLRADILNSFDELIAFYEPDHKIRWLNNAAKKQLGITDNSYIGKRCFQVWYNSSHPCSCCPAVSKSHELTERITTRGDTRSWLVRHTPLIGSDGNLRGYIEFSTDITEKQEQERIRRQLAADALYLSQKNKITLEIRGELDKIVASHKDLSPKTFKKIYDIIASYTRFDDDWELLKTHFEKVHPNFFTRLKQNYPNLSVNDIKHCACIKLNLDTKETARFFNVKPDSIQMSRVRLKKKMLLPETTDLRTFISDL